MSSEEFAELLTESYMGIDATFVQHLSMFLSSDLRAEFLTYIGVE